MELVDTHCHPQFEHYDSDRQEVLQASAKAGITKIIAVGCSLADSRRAIEFANQQAGVWATAGAHPHDGGKFLADAYAISKLEKMLKLPKVVAIGEIGLDFYHSKTPKKDQKTVLRAQIESGIPNGLPFVFHIREAWQDFWPIFDSYKNLKGVIHSFSAAPVWLDEVLSRGLHIGLNGLITYTKESSWRESAAQAPLDKILLETDAPFLTPVPFRGQRCTPAHTRITAEYLARLRGESLEQIAKTTTRNATALFGLDSSEKLTS